MYTYEHELYAVGIERYLLSHILNGNLHIFKVPLSVQLECSLMSRDLIVSVQKLFIPWLLSRNEDTYLIYYNCYHYITLFQCRMNNKIFEVHLIAIT